MPKTLIAEATAVLRPAARPILVALGLLVGAVVGLTAFGAISLSTAAGVVCGAPFGAGIAIAVAMRSYRRRSAPPARRSAATRRGEATDAAALDRLEPLDPRPR